MECEKHAAVAANRLTSKAFELGFELVGVASAQTPECFEHYVRWIDAGMHAGMSYLADRLEARRHPDAVLTGVRSLLMLGASYRAVLESSDNHPMRNHSVRDLSGVAEYARGEDYHRWFRRRLKQLSAFHREIFPDENCRGVVDTAPIFERQLAVRAGLGRIGKNTMLITERFGSKVFLGALLSTVDLSAGTNDLEIEDSTTNETALSATLQTIPTPDPCGSCRRCQDVCPTGALQEAFVLDARRCINYWTIEFNGKTSDIPADIRDKIGDSFFGCDRCLDVCPWNSRGFRLPSGRIDPAGLDSETLEKMIDGTPLERKRRRFKDMD